MAIDIDGRHQIDLILHIYLYGTKDLLSTAIAILIATNICLLLYKRPLGPRRTHIDIVSEDLELAETLQGIEDRDKSCHIATYGIEVVERRGVVVGLDSLCNNLYHIDIDNRHTSILEIGLL